MSPVLVATMSEDMDKQLKLTHKVVDVVDQANRKKFAILMLYNVEMPTNSQAAVQIFAGKKIDEKFQQIVYVNYKFEKLICVLM